jgi:hypothetical protein
MGGINSMLVGLTKKIKVEGHNVVTSSLAWPYGNEFYVNAC